MLAVYAKGPGRAAPRCAFEWDILYYNYNHFECDSNLEEKKPCLVLALFYS